MVDTGSLPIINSFKSASPKTLKIFVATLVLLVLGQSTLIIADCLQSFLDYESNR